ncbi:MAG: flagellar hook-associated protein FlgK [Gammaproteobacteria bacterium]|nr:flagellar hook-associated protein FlgK [Gammaproteobacteria bacterium]
MPGIVQNALTGLLAAQRALQTTSNNIANASTEGYSRQRVVQVQGPVIGAGNLRFGSGTQIVGIERFYDQLLTGQLTDARTSASKSQIVNQYALRLEGYLGDPTTGIGNSLQAFYAQLNNVAGDPTSNVNRQQLLIEAESLAQRFRQLGGQLDSLENEINSRLQSSVTTVNEDLRAIADLNGSIVSAGSGAANALFDERQLLIDRVAGQIDLQTTQQPDGSVSLMMNNGQPLVLGLNAFRLGVQQDEFNPQRLQLTLSSDTASSVVSRQVSGGEIGGLLSFRENMLDASRRDLGQIAIGITETFNLQNRQGLDLDGNLGGDMFAGFTPDVLTSSQNAGTASVAATFSDLSEVEPRDYKLRYDGAVWNFSDASGGAPIAVTGSGSVADPFVVDGMEVVVSGAPAAGDEFRIRPVATAANSVTVTMLDGNAIAAARPLTSGPLLANIGDATISPVTVNDVSNPNFLDSIRIQFDDPASSYQILDPSDNPLAGPFAYTSGDDISFNGWTVQIAGTPVAGDRFSIDATSAGSGDNSNANELARQFTQGYFNGGQFSVAELSAQLTTSVGSYSARSSAEFEVQTAIANQLELDVESVSGVNLDEEAANILRYQEAYLAASKMISVSNDLFQSIINAIR